MLKSVISYILILVFAFLLASRIVFAEDQIDLINRQITDLTRALSLSIAATRPHETELNKLKSQLADIEKRVDSIGKELVTRRAEIDKGYKKIEEQQGELNLAIREYYITSYYNVPFLVLLSQTTANDVTRYLAYQRAKTNEDKRVITNLALLVTSLEEKKAKLESEEEKLTALKARLDEQEKALDKLVGGAKAYQAQLSSQIAQLSAQQQQLVAQRLGNLNIPRSAATAAPACVDDRNIDPGFGSAIAFFTYGVPNRTGLNQYGAWGRAKAGQGEEVILKAYYEGINFETRPNMTIKVQGYGEMPLETYLLGIYEIPDSWTENNLAALKAQAIAARSYAIAYTNNGAGEICTTQSCQVYKGGNKGGNWEQAVKQTEGKVMVNNGAVIKAWFSSTHGGYILSTSELPGWSATSWTKHATDTTSGSAGSFSDLQNSAYDRESPWFYCDWGARSVYNKTAWLKSSEVSDIINVILLARADSSTKDHFYQTDKQHPYGGEVWNEDRVKQELRSRNITPYNSVSDISVSVDFGKGATSTVNISGDGGSQSFSGGEFKDWFNLRAPANIQIVGPLYNIERK